MLLSHHCNERVFSVSVLVLVIGIILGTYTVTSALYSWTNYTKEDGLADDNVLCLFESSDGSIWVGTKNGLSRYGDGGFITYNKGGKWWQTTVCFNIRSICQDCQGTIWCQDYNRGCGFLENGLIMPGFALYWEGYYTNMNDAGICLGPDCRLWAGFGDGIMWYDPATGSGEKVWTTPRNDQLDWWCIPHDLFVDSKGRVWFSSASTTYLMSPDGLVLKTFGGKGTVAESPDGTIWRGRFDVEWWDHWENDTIEDDSISAIERLEGDKFVDAGPPKLASGLMPCGPISISPATGEMVTFASYYSYSSPYIFTFDGEEWRLYNVPLRDPISTALGCLLIDRAGVIWVGTSGCCGRPGEGLWVLRRNLPPLPMFVGVETDASRYAAGETMQVRLDLVAEGEARTADLYIALEMPSGELLFYPAFGAEMTPFLSGIEIPANTHLESYELFRLTLPDLPAGTYRWYAALTHAGTMDFASNIASCDWQFAK